MSLIEIFAAAVESFFTVIADGALAVGYGAIVVCAVGAIILVSSLAVVRVVYPALKGGYGMLREGLHIEQVSE